MNGASELLVIALAVPAAMLLACLFPYVRTRMLGWLVLAPVPALAAAVLAVGEPPLTLPKAFYETTLAIDLPGAMLMGSVAILWIAAAAYAAAYLRDQSNAGSFAVWWLVAMIGNFGVFMAADIPSFYLFFALGSIGAFGLIIHNMTTVSRRAAIIYVAYALLGEALVLVGLVLLAAHAPDNSLLIRDAVAALPTSPWRDTTLAFLMLGFGLKIGLVPLHSWMPLAYTAAPIPAAAVLSGAAVKAGVIGFIRFLPFDAALPEIGGALAAAGIVSTFYGVIIGINRSNPKTVLAYSSVSQMGVLATLFGVGLATGSAGVTLAAGFYGAHHVLVKGGLFLAIGTVAVADWLRKAWLVLLPAAILALGLAGLPFTGGYLAKAAVKPFIGEGAFGIFAALSSAGTALLMLYFMDCLRASPYRNTDGAATQPLAPWLTTFVAASLVPWVLFLSAMGDTVSDGFSFGNFWTAIWPILIGGGLAIGWHRLREARHALRSWSDTQFDFAMRAAAATAPIFERIDLTFRQWQVAGISMLAITALLAAAIVSGY